MFGTGESDKENASPRKADADGTAKKRNRAPLAEENKPEVKKLKSNVEHKPEPLAEKYPKAKKADSDLEAAAEARAEQKKPESEPESEEGQEPKPAKKRAVFNEKEEPLGPLGSFEPKKTKAKAPEPAKASSTTKKKPLKTSSEATAIANNIISNHGNPVNADLDNLPAYLREEQDPQVLMRLLINSHKRCVQISSRVKAPKADMAEEKAEVKSGLEDLTSEIQALILEGKFVGTVSYLAQRKLGEIEQKPEDADVDVDMADTTTEG